MAGQIPEARSRLGPAMALVGNDIFFAWRGETSNHVWWTKADLATGSFKDGLKVLASIEFGPPQAKIAGTSTNFRPALASDRTNLALAWSTESGIVMVATFGAGGWSDPIVVPGAIAREEPAIAIWNSTIHLAWRDQSSGVLFGSYTFGSIFGGAGVFSLPIDLFALGAQLTDVAPPMYGDGTSHAPALASEAAYDGQSTPPGSVRRQLHARATGSCLHGSSRGKSRSAGVTRRKGT
jgi:hypothetical protein